ncbi:helix-turn-helix domain-containing protein [Streptomyces sp. NPDC056061]|uniref:helix-turn-helix domain-containing protein n=1 Tax=Streptomyces sp. NPDC056061 TaxID=3345700 RepID=UPI0035D788EB
MATSEAEDFAALLKELKGRSGLSYGVLAGRLHVSTSTLHRYCNGDAVPNEYAPVERLGRLCGAKPDELVELHRRWIVADAARRRPASTAVAEAAPAPAAASAPAVASASASAPVPVSGPGSVDGSEGGAPDRAPDRGPASAEGPGAEPTGTGEGDAKGAGDGGNDVTATGPTPSGTVSDTVAVPASVPASGSGAVTADATGAGTADARRRRFRASPRMRVLLAAAAVVALTVPTTIVVGKLSDRGDQTWSNAPMVDGVPNDDAPARPGAADGKRTASPGTPSASVTSGAPGSPSPGTGRTPSNSASAGSGKGGGSGSGGRTSSGVPVSATISSYNWDEPCGKYYVLDQKPEDVPPPPTPQVTRGWARALGGVDGKNLLLEVTVQGKSDEAVVLNGIHVREVSRKAPLPWTAYSMGDGCGSGIVPQSFDVDLDDVTPVLKPVAGQQGDERVPPKDFPFRVSSTDVEVLDLNVHVEGHDVSWFLELEWSSGGRTGTLPIYDGGKPFRTSAISALPLYTYRYDTAQWVPHE